MENHLTDTDEWYIEDNEDIVWATDKERRELARKMNIADYNFLFDGDFKE